MKKILFLFVSLLLLYSVKAQDTTLLSEKQLKKAKVYTNFDKALKSPEKVIILDLSGKNLDSLPPSIGQFKNLQVLKLGWKVKKSTSRILLWRSRRIGGGILHFDRMEGKYVNYNHISRLPKEIKNLTKLQYISMNLTDLSQVPFELADLKNLKYVNLAGCYGLINQKSGLEKLQEMLPAGCILIK